MTRWSRMVVAGLMAALLLATASGCGSKGKDSGGTLAHDLLRHAEQLSGESSPSAGGG